MREWGAGSLNSQGYVVLTRNGHGVKEHREVMGRKLGRKLLNTETVHHKNGDRTDNRPKNLELWNRAQPAGQRVIDLQRFAEEILALYGPSKK